MGTPYLYHCFSFLEENEESCFIYLKVAAELQAVQQTPAAVCRLSTVTARPLILFNSPLLVVPVREHHTSAP